MPDEEPAATASSIAREAGFDARALDQNRAGRLSFQQQLTLVLTPTLVVPIVVIGGLALALALGPLPLLARLGGILLVAIAVVAWWTWLSRLPDAVIGRAESVDGQLYWAKEKEEYGRGWYLTKYELIVGTKTLLVSKRGQLRIPTGGPYRIFYAPLSKTAVNIEMLDRWRPAGSKTAGRRRP